MGKFRLLEVKSKEGSQSRTATVVKNTANVAGGAIGLLQTLAQQFGIKTAAIDTVKGFAKAWYDWLNKFQSFKDIKKEEVEQANKLIHNKQKDLLTYLHQYIGIYNANNVPMFFIRSVKSKKQRKGFAVSQGEAVGLAKKIPANRQDTISDKEIANMLKYFVKFIGQSEDGEFKTYYNEIMQKITEMLGEPKIEGNNNVYDLRRAGPENRKALINKIFELFTEYMEVMSKKADFSASAHAPANMVKIARNNKDYLSTLGATKGNWNWSAEVSKPEMTKLLNEMIAAGVNVLKIPKDDDKKKNIEGMISLTTLPWHYSN